MSDVESELIDEAKRVALATATRREAGDEVSDEQVMAEHPHLRKHLAQHLGRLQRLRKARESHTYPTTDERIEPDDAVGRTEDVPNLRMTSIVDEPDDADLRGTLVIPRVPSESDVSDRSGTVADERVGRRAQLFRPTNRPPMGVLKLYLDGSKIFSPIPVCTDTFLIGRTDGALKIEHDPRISARHVEIQRREVNDIFHWYLVDQDSTNGTFVRVDHVVLKHGDEVLIGQARYRFINDKKRVGLGVVSDERNEIWRLDSKVNWIGRNVDGAIESIRADPFVDANHAIVRARANNQWVIVNNDSLNGIWFRISEVRMTGNCSFQIGEQRFGFRT